MGLIFMIKLLRDFWKKIFNKVHDSATIYDTDRMFYTYKYCENCGFVFRFRNKVSFYVIDENTLYESEYPQALHLKMEELSESFSFIMDGKIRYAYCPNCKEYIKIYSIIINRTYDDGIKLLENLIDKNEIFEMILIEETENTSEKIYCQKCDSLIITKIDEEYPCPICKGNVIKG